MKTKVESITPETARKYLKSNTSNRNVRQLAVSEYANEMRSGRWLLTHQGIAFDSEGVLIDGQHRLLAIIEAGVPIEMMVSRDLPKFVNGHAGLFTSDVVDNGRKRTVADQLRMNHGVENPNLAAAAARTIATICTSHDKRVPIGPVAQILSIYGEDLDAIIHIIGQFAPVRRAGIVGALTFAAKVHREETMHFTYDLVNGEEMKRGNPALALRNHLISHTLPRGGSSALGSAEWTCNALYSTILKKPLVFIKRGALGLGYFRNKQRGNVERVRVILGGE